MWILCIITYALIVGAYKLCKKMYGDKISPLVGNTIHCTALFVCSWIYFFDAIQLDFNYLCPLALKGLLVSTAWVINLYVIKHLDISTESLIANFSMVIVFIFGILIYNEVVSSIQIIGVCIIMFGVFVASITKKVNNKRSQLKFILLALLTTILNASTSLIDKYAMLHVNVGQMIFWYSLFAASTMWIYNFIFSIKQHKFTVKKDDFKVYWCYITAILLFIADSFLFLGLSSPNSMITITTAISKLRFIVVIIGGVVLFKEKITLQKIISLILIVCGVIIITMF